jgi:hypothetical protein
LGAAGFGLGAAVFGLDAAGFGLAATAFDLGAAGFGLAATAFDLGAAGLRGAALGASSLRAGASEFAELVLDFVFFFAEVTAWLRAR